MDRVIAFTTGHAGLVAVLILLITLALLTWAHHALVDLAVRAEREACASTLEAIGCRHDSTQWMRGAGWMRCRGAEVIRARGSHRTREATRRPVIPTLVPERSAVPAPAALSHDVEQLLRRN